MTEQRDGGFAPGPEALRLVNAVQDWASRTFPAAAEEHANGTCQWCPICQFVAVLRGERPEVTERVVEAGSALLSALRAFVDATTPTGDTGAHRADEPDPEPQSSRVQSSRVQRPRVQRIDLGDEPS